MIRRFHDGIIIAVYYVFSQNCPSYLGSTTSQQKLNRICRMSVYVTGMGKGNGHIGSRKLGDGHFHHSVCGGALDSEKI